MDAPSLIRVINSLNSLLPLRGNLSLQNVTFGPTKTLSSNEIPSHICTPFFIVTLLPIDTLFSMKTFSQILQFWPISARGKMWENAHILVPLPIFFDSQMAHGCTNRDLRNLIFPKLIWGKRIPLL
jgi:hypothetical protein